MLAAWERVRRRCLCRFIKIPMRPAGTEGWSEEQLRKLITRDSLVGVCFPRSPSQQ